MGVPWYQKTRAARYDAEEKTWTCHRRVHEQSVLRAGSNHQVCAGGLPPLLQLLTAMLLVSWHSNVDYSSTNMILSCARYIYSSASHTVSVRYSVVLTPRLLETLRQTDDPPRSGPGYVWILSWVGGAVDEVAAGIPMTCSSTCGSLCSTCLGFVFLPSSFHVR